MKYSTTKKIQFKFKRITPNLLKQFPLPIISNTLDDRYQILLGLTNIKREIINPKDYNMGQSFKFHSKLEWTFGNFDDKIYHTKYYLYYLNKPSYSKIQNMFKIFGMKNIEQHILESL